MIVNSNDIEWQEAGEGYPEGTKIKLLRDDDNGRTAILQLPEGFKMEGHSHINDEQHFILEGQYEIGEIAYRKGTYHFIRHGVTHGPFTSETGAEILVVWY